MSNIFHNLVSKLHGSHSQSSDKNTDTNTDTAPAPVSDPNPTPTTTTTTDPNTTNQAAQDTSKGTGKDQEPTFSILPHPAKSNDPADLQPGGGLRSGGSAAEIFNTPGPVVPTDDMKNNLPAPLSHEELQARQAALRSEVPGHGTQQGNIL